MKQNEDGTWPKGNFVEHYDELLKKFLNDLLPPECYDKGVETESRLIEIEMPRAFWNVLAQSHKQGQIDCLVREALYRTLFDKKHVADTFALAGVLLLKERKENA